MEKFTKQQIDQTLEMCHTKTVQAQIQTGNVAVAGLGGLGSNVAVALTRLGVGTMHLIDFDVVELSNLNRQHYFLEHIGMYKTDALKSQLLRINPYLNIRVSRTKVTRDNLANLLAEPDIICEAFDQPEEKAMLVNGVRELFPEKRLIAASGMSGYGSSQLIHTRKISDYFYLCGDETESVTAPTLMAPRVALCAAHEANMILRLILNQKAE